MLSLIYKRPIYQQQHINMIYKFKAMCNFNHLLLDSAGASVSSEISVSVFRHLRKVKQQPLIWIFNDFIESNCLPGPDHTCSSSLLTPPPPPPIRLLWFVSPKRHTIDTKKASSSVLYP